MWPLAILTLAWGALNPFAQAARGVLSNGMRVILLHDPSLPVVASTVLVDAGSEREDAATSGATHLLEHLLFQGTDSLTAEEFSLVADLHGVYLNAATRNRGTILMGLAPPDQLETMLSLQSQMLCCASLPSQAFEKEKEVVLEELAKDRANPDELLSLQRASLLWGPSSCRSPILGSPATLASMTRDHLVNYYRAVYVPGAMTVLVVGAFPWPETWEMLERSFGAQEPAEPPPTTPCPFAEESSLDTVWAPTPAPSVAVVFRGPGPRDPAFPAWFLAPRLLSSALPPRTGLSWDGSLLVSGEESRLLVVATGPLERLHVQELVRAVRDAAASVRERVPVQAMAWRSEALRWLERPHMLAIMAYDILSWGGWDALGWLWDRMGHLDPFSWDAASAWLLQEPVAAQVQLVGPPRPSFQDLDPTPSGPTGSTWVASPGKRRASSPPSMDPWHPGIGEGARDRWDTLASGLVLGVREEPGNDLAGVHFLLRHRGCLEPPGQEGVAELFHRCVGSGPQGWTEENFSHTLDSLGAVLQVTDDPWLPFDDYYYSSRWGYVRVTTPARSLRQVFSLVVAALCRPQTDPSLVARHRDQILQALSREARSPGKVASRTLWEGTIRGRSPLGVASSVERLTEAEVKRFWATYVVGGNIIVTVNSPLPADSVACLLRGILAEIPPGVPPCAHEPSFIPPPECVETAVGVGQGFLVEAVPVVVSPHERAAVTLLASVLDRRMTILLRERHGLAYSLGAGVSFEPGVAFLTASVATRPHRLAEARQLLRSLLDPASLASIQAQELEVAAMTWEQRQRLRSLTRVGRAFTMGLAAHDPWAADPGWDEVRGVQEAEYAGVAARLDTTLARTVLVR